MSQRAPVLMHAQPGGQSTPTLTVSKAPATRALHIAAEILAQPGLSLTACALLAEVLDLYQVKGQVFANDAHFAARCRCSERTVRTTISELEEGGYLERDVNARRSTKRLLVPTTKWQDLPEVVAEFAGSPSEVPANSAGSPGENCHESRQNLPRVPANSANINTNLNTKGNTNSNTPADAGARPEKKIGESEISHPALADPDASASHTRGGAAANARPHAYDPEAIAPNLRLPFTSAAFRATWVSYRTYRDEQKLGRLSGGMQEQQQLDKLAQLADNDETNALAIVAQTIEKGWKNLYPLDKPRTHASPPHPAKPGTARHHVPKVTDYGTL